MLFSVSPPGSYSTRSPLSTFVITFDSSITKIPEPGGAVSVTEVICVFSGIVPVPTTIEIKSPTLGILSDLMFVTVMEEPL